MKMFGAIALSLVALTAVPAQAAPKTGEYSFNTTGNMVDHGTYGNALTFKASDGSSLLNMKVTGWQINQSTNNISSAYVGAYSPGVGVTGINDQNGNNGYHQIDNAGNYTDFVMLQFERPVTLSSLTLNSFNLGSSKSKDNDLSFYAADLVSSTWNANINLGNYRAVPSLWTNVAGNGTDGSVLTGAKGASSIWLVGAGLNSTNDAFKIASITVNSAVPEPATWAMFILGFGAVGYSMRRRGAKVTAGIQFA